VGVRGAGGPSAGCARNWPRAIAVTERAAIAPMKTVIAVIAAMAYPVAPGGFVLVIHSSAQVIAMA